MQIELIGCTGAGKSTLAREIAACGRMQGIDILSSEDFVLTRCWCGWVKNQGVRTVLIDLCALSSCAAAWRQHRAFCRLAFRIVRGLPCGLLERLNIIRNVLKKVGVYEIIRRHGRGRRIVLTDEGTLHAVHNLFVHTGVEPNSKDVGAFMQLVPVPNVVVQVEEEEAVLVARTSRNGHKRIPSGSQLDIGTFVRRALHVFQQLSEHPAVQSRIVVLNNHTGDVKLPRHLTAAVLRAERVLAPAVNRIASNTEPSAH